MPPDQFGALTLQQFIDATDAASKALSVNRATSAWMIARLQRLQRLPSLDEILPRPPRTQEQAAADLAADMAVYREIAAERGQIRSWDEWRRSGRS